MTRKSCGAIMEKDGQNSYSNMQEEIQMAKEVHKILWDVLDNGRFELIWDDAAVLGAYAQARHIDGRMIDTREAK